MADYPNASFFHRNGAGAVIFNTTDYRDYRLCIHPFMQKMYKDLLPDTIPANNGYLTHYSELETGRTSC
jgi:hypothetical protein